MRTRLLLAFAFLLACPMPGHSVAGLSTTFTDVYLGPVPLGTPSSVRQLGGPEFVLINTGQDPLKIKIDVLRPGEKDLRHGAGPIPDTGWVQISPNPVIIPAGGSARCEVVITVPKNLKYRRKIYQAMIWSHGESQKDGGVSLGIGLMTRLGFTTPH